MATSKKTFKNKNSITAKKITFESLNKWNLALSGLHAVQGIIVLVLAKTSTLPVNIHYLTKNDLASQTAGHVVLSEAVRHLYDINLAYLVAAFFFMSAIAHLIIATKYRKTYENNLKKGINMARWVEYGISASTMMVAIGLLSGVYDIATLFAMFMLVLIMNLCGLIMEIHNQTSAKTNWLSYIVGSIAGITPWLIVGFYLKGTIMYGTGHIPTFVYWIYGSLLLLFASFAVNMYLQYKKIGKWADYLYGERMYMLLSLVAKTALAWQVFFGTLRP